MQRPTEFSKTDEKLFTIEITMTDGVFVKLMGIPRAEMYVSQHTHTYDHSSFVAKGSVMVWVGDDTEGTVFHARQAILIKAHTAHLFMSLEDDTQVYCIHNISRTGEVDVDHDNPFHLEP